MKRILFALALTTLPTLAQAEQAAGLMLKSMVAPHLNKTLEYTIWYPATDGTISQFAENGVFKGVQVSENAKIKEGKFPVILLSHGLGGNFRSMSWLSAGLAEKGSIIISVNHPNSTTRDFDLASGLNHWTRVQDLQVALEAATALPEFKDHVDLSRVYATGFSYGGWTALSIAGVRGDISTYAAHCAKEGASSSHCKDIAKGGIDLNTYSAEKWNGTYRDARVRKVAAIEPALTWGLNQADVKNVSADVLLIGLGEGKDRLFATNTSVKAGSGFDVMIPKAEIDLIAPASHFTALLECKPAGAAILKEEGEEYPICTDPIGANRADVHQKIVNRIATFFGLK